MNIGRLSGVDAQQHLLPFVGSVIKPGLGLQLISYVHCYCNILSGRTPIPPPLHAKFLVIENQREEEAALGEQPLEQVLAPVPVPIVSS
jgi:hypothetical protein